MAMVIDDPDLCYQAAATRDARFDGRFVMGVTSTGIYCRPSCPAVLPKRANVRFYVGAAAARAEGFRACLRCYPDASPGSPDWNVRADLAARAVRAIADGEVDRAGVAGFGSLRQFNDSIRAAFGRTPTELRTRRARSAAGGSVGARTVGGPDIGADMDVGADIDASFGETIELRLAVRQPFDGADVLAFLARRAVLRAVAEAVADGHLDLTPGADRETVRAELLALPGIGPWTAAYVLMRGFGSPDEFLPGDAAVRNAARALGLPHASSALATHADAWRPWRPWRPWRSYALHRLWRYQP